MVSIMKRGDSYSVRYKYKDHSGKPCEGWESFKTKKEAQERKITVEKELLDGTFLVPDTMTVEEMLYKWIPIQSTKHKWSPKTYTQSVAMVQNLIVPYAVDGRGTISVSKTMQRANKDALEKLDPNQVYHTFPDRREGSKSSLILKKPKTKKSNRVLYMTKPLKEELQAWLEKLKQDEQNAPEKYSNCGQLFRLPDGLPIAPELLTKWYRLWRAEHPEFEQIVFHGLRHSSATYQLLQSDGDFKSVQGNTGHATAAVLMDTYAHTQDKPRLELTEKIEANFYSQDLTPVAPQPRQNEKPAATKISGKEILEAIRLMDADERRELTRALFA